MKTSKEFRRPMKEKGPMGRILGTMLRSMNTGWRQVFGTGIVVLLGLTTALGAAPQFQVLHSFTGGAEGASPQDAGVVIDDAGNLYGTTLLGGDGWGTIYKINSDGSWGGLLHSFAPLSEGGLPDATLAIEVATHTLYGTTYSWGQFGLGTIFKVQTDGSAFAVLHHFAGGANDGAEPAYGALALDGNGNIYGTTWSGGLSNLGTVFTLRTDGSSFAVLHSFTGIGGNDGANPRGLIVNGANLYGTTTFGGPQDLGTIFILTTAGTGYAVVHPFDYGTGAYPNSPPLLDAAGNLYTTTAGGGALGRGTVFKILTDGSYGVLHDFSGGPDGQSPSGSLIVDGAESLYGTTMFGGTLNGGTVFTLQKDGSGFSVLYNFDIAGGAGAAYPRAPLALAQDGTGALYGTTQSGGGVEHGGVVFKLTGVVPDTTKPTVTCIPPAISGWINDNVTVPCTAIDTGSGLADPAAAAFDLQTTVPPDAETANASTGDRRVYDQASNYAVAGPYFYDIDRKPPTINVSTPVDGDVFVVGQSVAADYNCNDFGSGLQSCTGTVASGAAIDTATAGPKTFEVDAADLVGNPISLTVNYTVNPVTVIKVPTTTVLSSSKNPSLVGDVVTITAVVTGSAPTAAGGGVTFIVDYNNGAPLLGSVTGTTATTLTATIQINLAEGSSHNITARYSGDANNESSTATSLQQTVAVGESSGTAVRAIVTGRIGSINHVRDRIEGDFAVGSSISPLLSIIDVGSSYARGWLPAGGPSVSAWSMALDSGNNTGAARAIAYATYINQGSQPVTAPADAVLDGSFGFTSLSSHAAGAVYVFDRDLFLTKIQTSGQTLKRFLLSGSTQNTLAAYAVGDEATLSLKNLFDPAAYKTSVFEVVSPSTGGSVATTLQASFTVDPGKSVIIVFDLTVYAPVDSFVDFSATLKPAPTFLRDPAGNPLPLTAVGLWSPEPPPVANLTLAPATTTNPLTTPVTVTATATTTSGAPVPNTQVFLEITAGPDAQSIGPAVTDSNGQVIFTYSGGSVPGTDQIQASIGPLQSNIAQVTWTAGPLDHISISPASATTTVGASQSYTAQALDAFNNSIGDVTAGMTFSISPEGSCTGASCTASVAGAHNVTGTYAGKTATATLDVTAPAATHFSVAAPVSVTAGSAFNITVRALDASNNTVSGYTGTVHFTSSDAQAILPSNYTFLAGDAGVKTFSVTLKTAGSRTVTATDTSTSITGTATVGVNAGSPASIMATAGTPQSAAINTAFATNLAATVKDSSNNLVSGVVVTFTAPSSGASGMFAGGLRMMTATTNASGVATAPVFTANGMAGSYAVAAAFSAATSPTRFSLTNTYSCTALSIDPPTLHAGKAGKSYSSTLTAVGGVGAVTFAVSDGSLPPGLHLSAGTPGASAPGEAGASHATLSGFPTQPGSFAFTIAATDSRGCTGSRSYTLIVISPKGNGKIAYSKAPEPGIFAVNPNGQGETRILKDGIDPAWAPSGKALAFVRFSGSDSGVWASVHRRRSPVTSGCGSSSMCRGRVARSVQLHH